MNRTYRFSSLAILSLACVTAMSSLADSFCRVAAVVRDFALAPFKPEATRLLQLHAPATWVPVMRAFVGRLANRFRPQMTVGWRMCASA